MKIENSKILSHVILGSLLVLASCNKKQEGNNNNEESYNKDIVKTKMIYVVNVTGTYKNTVTSCKLGENGTLSECKTNLDNVPGVEGIAIYKDNAYLTINGNDGLGSEPENRKVLLCKITADGTLNDCKTVAEGKDDKNKLGSPVAIAVNNKIAYVTDTDNNKINSFTLNDDNTFGTQSGTNLISVFKNPYGIAIHNDYAYVVNKESENAGVSGFITSCKLNDDGTFSDIATSCKSKINKAGTVLFNKPYGIAIYDNYVYVTNTIGNSITSCKISDGNSDDVSQGISAGELKDCDIRQRNYLNSPTGIVINNDYAYVANADDTVTSCKLGENGTFTKCNKFEGDDYKFSGSLGIAIYELP